MRKNILKKLVAVVATTAMAFGMIATNSVNAAAAETVYLHGQFNNWVSGVALTSTDGVTYTGDVEVNANGNMCVLLTADNWQDCGTITSITRMQVRYQQMVKVFGHMIRYGLKLAKS